jgi:hypothetical protein
MSGSPFPRAALAGATYFVLAFGAGFLLALVRIPFLEPRFGTRVAELAEMPVMGVVMFLAAGWTIRRFGIAPVAGPRLVMGAIALALLLAAEFGGVLFLRGITLDEHFATRDPVSGTVYALMLVVFALLPWALARRGT